MLRTGARHPDAAASTSRDVGAPPAAADGAPAPAHSPTLSPSKASAAPVSSTPVEDEADDVQNLHATLAEYLQLEPKFQPRLYLPKDHEVESFKKNASYLDNKEN
ncbi:hypothetical protein EVAR_98389_1 [Eumeta japonica]|uniref:Uncharacterized protein n=1 Tax=Eumeta variegata TaxID=151549 RepID=A0A4C1XP17_EUMVA|nr:hypothetical protein EVAR_98389_1 [Eumeta japonica]